MNFDQNSFSAIIYTAVIAFFGALCREINDRSQKNKSFSVFFGEIVLHGFSGWIVGLCANKYLNLTDLTSITIFAGIGGLFGYGLVKVVLKIILLTIANSRNIKLNDSDTNLDEDDNSEQKTKKKK